MATPSAAKKMQLLLVEDDATVARAVVRLFRAHGYEVHLIDRCDALRNLPKTCDIGVFDIDLPDGNGVDLAEDALRAGFVSVAVFYTGTVDASLLARARLIGPIVAKSDRPGALVEAMDAAITASLRALAVNGEGEAPRDGLATGVRRKVPR